METVDYTNHTALIDFAGRLNSLGDGPKAVVAAAIINQGLMKPKGFWAVTIWCAVRFGAWIRGEDRFVRFAHILARNKAGIEYADSIIAQTTQHVIYGRDTSDTKSAGGFSRLELAVLQKIVEAVEQLPIATPCDVEWMV